MPYTPEEIALQNKERKELNDEVDTLANDAAKSFESMRGVNCYVSTRVEVRNDFDMIGENNDQSVLGYNQCRVTVTATIKKLARR